jgi:hypothetical protein
MNSKSEKIAWFLILDKIPPTPVEEAKKNHVRRIILHITHVEFFLNNFTMIITDSGATLRTTKIYLLYVENVWDTNK